MAYFDLNETLTNLPHFSLTLQKLGLKFQIVCFETFCQICQILFKWPINSF